MSVSTATPSAMAVSSATPMHTLWAAEKWTDNDKPFIVAKQGIEKKLKANYDPLKLAAKYEAQVEQKPNDPIPVFGWGLSLFYASKVKPRTWEPSIRLKMLRALDSTPSPHSMQYDRMRFLVQSHFLGEFFLKKMGLRLLQQNPQDDEVKASMRPILNVIGDPTDAHLALTYAKQLIAKYPYYPKWYAMLGSVYYDMAINPTTRTRTTFKHAISAYQKYLALAKPNDPFRERAKYLIDVLQKDIPKQ